MKNKMPLVLFVAALSFPRPSSAAAGGESPRAGKETPMTKEDLFRKIDALAKLKTLTQKSVSKALGTTLEFEDVSGDDLSKDVEAYGKPGAAIELIDLRGDPGQFLAVGISTSLAVTGDDIRSHFGPETGTHLPGNHAASDSPWYFVYSKPDQQLKFGMQPGTPDVLLRVILDRTGSN